MDRVEVGIRELRLNLSRYVRRARAGTEVIVTDHGRPVARIGPVDASAALYARLVAEGKITPARRRKSAELPPPVEALGSVSDLLLEDRH